MSALKDLTGQRFGRLTVIERAENSKKDKHVGIVCAIVGISALSIVAIY